MAYFKPVYYLGLDKKEPGKYYPLAVSIGRVTTDDLCDEIAEISTVSHADVVATLKALNRVIGRHLVQGQTVQLKGLCNIRLTIQSSGNGVATPEEVSAKQIKGWRMKFIGERQGTSATGIGYAIDMSRLRWQALPSSLVGKEEEDDEENENNQPNNGTTNNGDNGNTGDNGSGDNGNNNGGSGDGTED